ncbi:MAG: GIY-YIG nuclease family protein, partial [bacterium]
MIYVGSTYKTLEQRLKGHKYAFKQFTAGKKVSILSSYKILKNGNYSIELIENYPSKSKQKLIKREGYYIKLYRNQEINIVNKCIAGQDPYERLNCKCGYSYIHKHQAKHNRSYTHCKNLALINNITGNNNNIEIKFYCPSKNDIKDLIELEKEFINVISGDNNHITININFVDELEQLE